MPLRPEIKAKIEADLALGAPQVWEVPVEVSRRNSQSRVALAGKAEPIHSIIDRYFPGPTSYLHIRIYRPTEKRNAPAIVFFHGGGWVLNFLDIYDASMVRLANQSGATIIAVSYQKAPEHPFPTPFNDCYATLLWVRENYEELGIKKDRATKIIKKLISLEIISQKLVKTFIDNRPLQINYYNLNPERILSLIPSIYHEKENVS